MGRRRLVVSGALPVVRIAAKWRLDVEDLDALSCTLKVVRRTRVRDRRRATIAFGRQRLRQRNLLRSPRGVPVW